MAKVKKEDANQFAKRMLEITTGERPNPSVPDKHQSPTTKSAASQIKK